jgi:hypothetical protein
VYAEDLQATFAGFNFQIVRILLAMIMAPPSTESPGAGYGQGYSADVDTIREQEYPLINGTNI